MMKKMKDNTKTTPAQRHPSVSQGLQASPHPSIWTAYDEFEALRETYQKPAPSTSPEIDRAFGPMSLSGIIGLETQEASPEEKALWKKWCTHDPKAQKQRTLVHSAMQQKEVKTELEQLLALGKQLEAEASPLPIDFWKESQTDIQHIVKDSDLTLDKETHTHQKTQKDLIARLSSFFSLDFWLTPHWGFASVVGCLALLISMNTSVTPKNKQVIWPLGPNRAHPKGSEFKSISDAGKQYRATEKAPSSTKLPKKSTPRSSKARIQFETFIRRGTRINRLGQTSSAQPQDQLRFMYTSETLQRLYLTLFMIDAKGTLSRLYPSTDQGTFVLPPATERFLPSGAVLDSITGPERLFVCVSTETISYTQVQERFRKSLQRHSITHLKTLPWNCLYQRTWLLQPKTDGSK